MLLNDLNNKQYLILLCYNIIIITNYELEKLIYIYIYKREDKHSKLLNMCTVPSIARGS